MALASPPPSSASVQSSKLSRLHRCWQWLEDRANPLLVRTLRQEMRSRVFIAAYQLALLAGTLVAMVLCWWPQSSGSDAADGQVLFATTAIVWSLVAWTVVPIAMTQALIREAAEDSWYLLELTGMRPWRILGGHIQSAFFRGLWIGCALLPFLGLSYLLRGVDLWLILSAIILIPLGSAAVASVVMLVVSLGVHMSKVRQSVQGLASLAATGMGLVAFPLWIEGMPGVINELMWLMPTEGVVLMLLIIANWAVVGIGFPLILASAQLTHVAENRSTWPRLAVLALIANLLAWPMAVFVAMIPWSGASWSSFLNEFLEPYAVLVIPCTFLLAALGLFAVTEGRTLSQRQRRSLSGAWWRRSLMVIVGPGCGRGRLCVVVVSLVLMLVTVAVRIAADWVSNSWRQESLYEITTFSLSLLSFAVIWLAVGEWVLRFFRLTPLLRRVLMLVLLALWLGGLPIVIMLMNQGRIVGPLWWWSPVGLFDLADKVSNSGTAVAVMAAQWILGVLALISLAVRGVLDLRVEVPRKRLARHVNRP